MDCRRGGIATTGCRNNLEQEINGKLGVSTGLICAEGEIPLARRTDEYPTSGFRRDWLRVCFDGRHVLELDDSPTLGRKRRWRLKRKRRWNVVFD